MRDSAVDGNPPYGEIVDVHSHIHSEDFDQDRVAVLARAAAKGVAVVFAVGEGADDNRRVLDVAARHGAGPCVVVPCLGLHPDQVRSDTDVEVVVHQIRKHRSELGAIGEVGLDYWVAKEEPARAAQRAVLERLAALSKELDLPLSVHSRSAGHHTISLLESCGASRVCMHAFDGRPHYAERAAEELGYFFSIPPSILRSPQKQKLVRRLPLSALLLETDSPVLGPNRMIRNEPENARLAAEEVARIKGESVAAVLEVARANTRQLFSL